MGVHVASARAQAVSAGNANHAGPRREVRGQLGASINNLGLQNSLDMSWTWPVSDSLNPLLSGAHISVGATHALTPAQMRLGGWFEYSPLSILDVRAGIDPSAYFGTFNSLMSFDAYTDPFDSDTRDVRGRSQAGAAGRAYVSPTVKLQAGALVMSASADVEWWKSNAPGAFFYEPTRDTLLKSSGDRMVTTTSVVLYQRKLGSGGTLSAGGIHMLSNVFDAPANRIQRVGVVAIREYSSPRFHLPHPRVTAAVTYYVDDPSKQGQVSGALAVGFKFGK
jgi:hypothetical protein